MPVSLSRRPSLASIVLLVGGVAAVGAWAASDPLVATVTTLVVVMLLPVLHASATGRPIDPLEPLWPFLVCYSVSFVLKPLLVVSGYLTYGWTNIDRPSAAIGVLWATGALLFIYLGYYAVRPGRLAGWISEACPERSWAGIRTGAALLSLGGVASILLIASLSGIPPTPAEVFSERFRQGAFEAVYGRGYLTVLLALSVFGPAAQWYVALATRRWADRSLGVLWLVLVTGVVLCFYSRALLVQLFILLFVVLHFKGGWLRARTLLAIGAVLLIFAGGLGLRRIGQADQQYLSLSSLLGSVAFLGHTFDSFEFLVPAVQRLSIFGELSGQSLVEDLVWTFIPRALVPNKPDTYGAVLVQNTLMSDLTTEGAQLGTYPAGFLVEWYVNFGVCGFLFIAFAYGAMLRVAGAVVARRNPALLPLLVYGGVVLNLVGLFRSSSQMLVQAIIYTVLLVLVFARWPTPIVGAMRPRPVQTIR